MAKIKDELIRLADDTNHDCHLTPTGEGHCDHPSHYPPHPQDMEAANSFKNSVAIAKASMTIDLMARIINGELTAAENREFIARLAVSAPAEHEEIPF